VFAEPQNYVIDPDHLSVGFLVTHVGYAKTLGLFRNARGKFTFDETTGKLSDLRVVVDTNSVFTNHDKRDEHLRGEDFLNTEQFPEMVFTAKDAKRTGEDTFQVVGDLTLLGETKPLSLDVTWNKSATYPFRPGVFTSKPYVLGASAQGTVRRSDYGMTYAIADGLVGDDVELLIEFEARRE
jgi:polyisoprenoid-binding protein YceI